MSHDDRKRAIGKVVSVAADRFVVEMHVGTDNFTVVGFDDVHYVARLGSFTRRPQSASPWPHNRRPPAQLDHTAAEPCPESPFSTGCVVFATVADPFGGAPQAEAHHEPIEFGHQVTA